MKPASFRYARPDTLEETVALLASSGGQARLLAGGQSLVPRLNMRLERPSVLIDLALVPELEVLTCEGGELVIGAGTRQRAAETSALVRDTCPLIPLALDHAGPVQIRHRGTIGGSLAHADPAAELPAVAVALDAALVAVGPGGRRSIAAGDFFHGPYSTALDEDEVLTEMRLPVLRDTRCAFLEVAMRSRTAASAGVAAAVRIGDGRRVAEARLAAIGVDGAPVRLASAEEAARGTTLEPSDRARAAAGAVEDVERANGPRSEAAYSRRLVATLVARALEAVAA